MCQSEAEGFIYSWCLKPIVWLWSKQAVTAGPKFLPLLLAIMPRSFLVKRRKSEDTKSVSDSGKLEVNLILYLKFARVPNDRSVILLAVPLHCLGTVDFRCQHAETELSIPHHWSSRWENWKMICVYVKKNIALINSSLFELLTDSLFNFTFAKSYHRRTLTRWDFSATREKLYNFIHLRLHGEKSLIWFSWF